MIGTGTNEFSSISGIDEVNNRDTDYMYSRMESEEILNTVESRREGTAVGATKQLFSSVP